MNCARCGATIADTSRFCGSCGNATLSTATAATHAPVVTTAPDLTGREIAGRYRMLAKLGEGGMGAVYRAEQISLKRKVAVKLLKPELSSQPGLVRRFNAEAELAAKLSHPNTVNIYDFGQDTDGTLFIAMEYVEGKSLRQVLQAEGAMAPARALNIVAQIASSLTDAHAHGIVHRDLKPDNVMLTERGKQRDVVRVLDFGIAKLRDDGKNVEQAMTRAGDLVGTPQYMAPEQIRAETVDGRTDVYAVGAMLYEMVTGRLPFEGPTLMAILSKHLTENAEPPSRRRPDLRLPPPLDQLVLETLAKEPAQRTPSMERLGDRVIEVAAALGAPIAFGPVSGPSTAQVPLGSAAPAGFASAPAFSPPPPGPPPGPPLGPPTPGRPLMRPPGVPHTYPPGVLVAPPEPIPAKAAELTPPPPAAYPSPYPAAPSPYAPPAPSPYAPPGYVAAAASHPAPLPAGTPPPPSHMPTPAPMPQIAAAKPTRSRAPIIVMLALALAGAAVAVVLVVTHDSGKDRGHDGSGSNRVVEDDDADDSADDSDDGDDSHHGPPEVTVSVQSVDLWKDGPVLRTRMGSTLTLPDGMAPGVTKEPVPDGWYFYSGNFDGAPVRVLFMEVPESPKKDMSQQIAKSLLKTNHQVDTGEQVVGGQPWETAIIEGTDMDDTTLLRMEVMLYADGKRVVGLFVGTTPDQFANLGVLRAQMFSRRFQP